MAIKLDNLHYSFRAINGYNKAFNFVVSARELGKTTSAWMELVYFPWKKNKRPWIYLVRQKIEIDESLIDSICDVNMNKFTDDNIVFEYNKSSFKSGVVDVCINGEKFMRVIALSNKLRKLKLSILKNCGGVLMDEYIINPKMDERYLKDEAYKIKEAYTTWRRECDGILKMYFLGNPYSLYNPLFVDWGVDTNKLRIGEFYVGDNYVIHYAKISDALKEHLLKVNPLYKFDEDYMQYALEGKAVLDSNIKVIDKQPMNYSLSYIFKLHNKYVGLYRNNAMNNDDRYWAGEVDEVSRRRTIYCFDFEELVERSILLSLDERSLLNAFKNSMRKRAISFESIEIYYLIEDIYNNI